MLYLDSHGDSSCINEDIQNHYSVECDFISIDEFVKSNKLNRVDYIKLDVEGAELNALKGSIETISKFKPKLAISLYHKWEDIFHIPLFLNEICENYKFYIGHHCAGLHETILYAKHIHYK
ncbi:MAG: FkbM family methyltransferase [Desulfovibrio sp.]|jgi:hypothetical protein|nr:FkbM family methyltransferase [Desulfovibrio sp.]